MYLRKKCRLPVFPHPRQHRRHLCISPFLSHYSTMHATSLLKPGVWGSHTSSTFPILSGYWSCVSQSELDKGSVPQDCPHFRCQLKVQVVTRASDWLLPMTHARGLFPLLKQLTEFREPIYFLDCPLIMKGIKWHKWTARYSKIWEGPKYRSFCPHRLWCYPLGTWIHSDSTTWKLSEPPLFRF